MNDQSIEDILAYHQPLDGAHFRQQLLQQLAVVQARRRRIMVWFCVLGVLLTLVYLWWMLPSLVWSQLFTPINGLLLFGIGVFVIWLWTDTLTSH
ncbi:hypothetical protein [Marinicella meishanensis]|uniref:hypothetical protein n=1 Tax=Marinicella meishanensis TaxID=2873263 RepID=UPI001CBE8F24|nr:hypothetical protein [Marinicella sp. NBU2979]